MGSEVLGGQAVIEGVMMINGNKKAIAVRNPKGKIVIQKEKLKKNNSKFFKLPFIRGVFNLFSMMIVGVKALNFSTSVALEEEEESISDFGMFLLLLSSIVFALFLFKFLPLLITKFVVSKVSFLQTYNFIPNAIDGILKISIFIFYVYLMTLSKDMKRIFEYHGAEHKVIRCKEAGLPLTVKNVRKFSRLHPRCGTAFIFGVFLISIVVYNVIPFNTTGFFENLFLRILLLPVIMGISYEVLKLSGKNENNIFFKIITAPGIWMQMLTTKEPSDNQIKVGIASLKATM